MTATEVAFGSGRPRTPLPWWAAALLGLAITVAGLVSLAGFFAGPGPYADIARASGFERIPFLVPANVPVERRQTVTYDVPTRVVLHEETIRYVFGATEGTARDPTTRDPLFTPDEQRHLADVRRVFALARDVAFPTGILALGIALVASLRGWVILLITLRGAAALGAILVATIGVVSAIAFEQVFLLFHEVFFPQGNFLFDPQTSNLLALYPEPYWYGVTIRIGATFVASAASVAGVATLALRRGWAA